MKVTGKKTRLYVSMSEAVIPNILFRSFMSHPGFGGGGSPGGGAAAGGPAEGGRPPPALVLFALGVGIIGAELGGGGGTIGGGSGCGGGIGGPIIMFMWGGGIMGGPIGGETPNMCIWGGGASSS